MMKHIQTWLLITLLALSANGAVSAKVASGPQNLSSDLHQSQTVLNALLHQGLERVSTTSASGSPLAAKGRVNSAGQPINDKGQFTGGAGGDSAAAARGRAAHDAFDAKVRAKSDQGWVSQPRIVDANGKTHIPDALTPSGRPIEYKPNTPSGIKAGRRQLKRYEQVTGKKGRLLTYD